jgi:hypothetical protein
MAANGGSENHQQRASRRQAALSWRKTSSGIAQAAASGVSRAAGASQRNQTSNWQRINGEKLAYQKIGGVGEINGEGENRQSTWRRIIRQR